MVSYNFGGMRLFHSMWSRSRRPSAWWPVLLMVVFTLSFGMRVGSRVEGITRMVCEYHLLDPRFREEDSATSAGAYKSCKTDIAVQKIVAQVNTVTLLVTGLLGCLTVAWWGSISDRYGRSRVIAITSFGALSQDLNFIVTFLFHRSLPGAYWFLLVSAVIEGLCGGAFIAAAGAAMIAYISDCTESSSRSRIFSLFLGALYTGTAVGPSLGGVVLRLSGQSLLSVFYASVALDASFLLIAWTALPESLSAEKRQAARQTRQDEANNREESTAASRIMPWGSQFVETAFHFAAPLAVFSPPPTGAQGFAKKKDWRIVLTVSSYFFSFLAMGSLNIRVQYMLSNYNWEAEQVGYWLTVSTGMRAVCLALIIPFVIKLWKKQPAIQLPTQPHEPLDVHSPVAVRVGTEATSQILSISSAIRFDLRIAQASILVEIIAYGLMPLAPTGLLFTGATALGSLGSGFQPAIQSIALELHEQRGNSFTRGDASGRLFGAIGVLETLAAQVIGPALCGLIYVHTVKVLPAAIFIAISFCFGISLLLISCVQPNSPMLVVIDENRARNGSQNETRA